MFFKSRTIAILFFVLPYSTMGAPSSLIDPYTKLVENPEAKIKQFQNDFTQALKNPVHLAVLGEVYTDGFRNDIAYSEFGPSFVAFIKLHQALYKYIVGKENQAYAVPPAIYNDFIEASHTFDSHVSKLSSLKNLDAYEDQLNTLYKGFLVNFINNHRDFFKGYVVHQINGFKGDNGSELDMLSRAFFALTKGWPSYETNDSKYQFEKLYVWFFGSGHKVLIGGYNDDKHACGKYLNLYVWDFEKPESKPTKITHDKMEFDLSPRIRSGGCSYPADVPNVIHFEAPYLQFYGYDNTLFRYYIYNIDTNQWKIVEVPNPVSK